jgi:hypothetical protein
MRKVLIAAALLAGAGAWAAWASENRADPTQQGLQQEVRPPAGTDTLRKDDERLGTPRHDRLHEARERRSEEHWQARRNEEDEDD